MSNRGMLVTVDYRGTFEDGTEFDTTYGKKPVQFVCMDKTMVTGFTCAVNTMEVGETRTVTLQPSEAFGIHAPEMVVHYPKDKIPNPKQYDGLVVGDRVSLRRGHEMISSTVVEISDEEIVLDLNHPLAGKVLIFEITLLKVEEAPKGGKHAPQDFQYR